MSPTWTCWAMSDLLLSRALLLPTDCTAARRRTRTDATRSCPPPPPAAWRLNPAPAPADNPKMEGLPMRRWMTVACVLAAVSVIGCAGPAKLAQKSQDKLAQGDVWKAWELATRALDKAPA